MKKEESCCKLEAEIVDLRKKVEKSNKFLNSSRILDEILESQRSSCDKSGLGYKGEDTHAEASTSKKHEVNISNKEDNVAKQPSTQGKENFKRIKQGRHQEAILGTPKQRYESIFHGHCFFFHVMDMVTKILNVDLMKEDIIEESITPQDVGDVIK
jgi:hypothetical protein